MILKKLFRQWAGTEVDEVTPLALSGSNRRYFRLRAQIKPKHTGQNSFPAPSAIAPNASTEAIAIGVISSEEKENRAFLAFSKHFKALGLPVPTIYAETIDQGIYLQEDLGDTALLDLLLLKRRETGLDFPDPLPQLYRDSLKNLARLQICGGKGLDYSLCTPRAAFDQQSVMWDLNYFKYYFLKPSGVTFDEQLLENDFLHFAKLLDQTTGGFFMFRDFQARNIMVRDNQTWFIDYQGGRKGPLQYDVCSLLFQAKAALSEDVREELLEHYIACAGPLLNQEFPELPPLNQEKFKAEYYSFVLIRTLQVLGAYGFRGYFERKQHFLESIPFALQNLAWVLPKAGLESQLPHLYETLLRLPSPVSQKKTNPNLTVHVSSFSYKEGIPIDESGHGGGFVFDCRALHNPGRYAPYKKLTGRDKEVIDFLLKESEIQAFLQDVYALVDRAVETYIERGFDYLSVSFGCTGGQHRSVFSADSLANHLKTRYGLNVVLSHLVQDRKKWIN